jgi:hypothetical protein
MKRSTATTRKTTREAAPPSLIAYHVVERAQDKRFWTRIGAAWPHEDGEGMTLQLDLVPTGGGRIVLRAPREEHEEHAEPAERPESKRQA